MLMADIWKLNGAELPTLEQEELDALKNLSGILAMDEPQKKATPETEAFINYAHEALTSYMDNDLMSVQDMSHFVTMYAIHQMAREHFSAEDINKACLACAPQMQVTDESLRKNAQAFFEKIIDDRVHNICWQYASKPYFAKYFMEQDKAIRNTTSFRRYEYDNFRKLMQNSGPDVFQPTIEDIYHYYQFEGAMHTDLSLPVNYKDADLFAAEKMFEDGISPSAILEVIANNSSESVTAYGNDVRKLAYSFNKIIQHRLQTALFESNTACQNILLQHVKPFCDNIYEIQYTEKYLSMQKNPTLSFVEFKPFQSEPVKFIAEQYLKNLSADYIQQQEKQMSKALATQREQEAQWQIRLKRIGGFDEASLSSFHPLGKTFAEHFLGDDIAVLQLPVPKDRFHMQTEYRLVNKEKRAVLSENDVQALDQRAAKALLTGKKSHGNLDVKAVIKAISPGICKQENQKEYISEVLQNAKGTIKAKDVGR